MRPHFYSSAVDPSTFWMGCFWSMIPLGPCHSKSISNDHQKWGDWAKITYFFASSRCRCDRKRQTNSNLKRITRYFESELKYGKKKKILRKMNDFPWRPYLTSYLPTEFMVRKNKLWNGSSTLFWKRNSFWVVVPWLRCRQTGLQCWALFGDRERHYIFVSVLTIII